MYMHACSYLLNPATWWVISYLNLHILETALPTLFHKEIAAKSMKYAYCLYAFMQIDTFKRLQNTLVRHL